MNDKIEKSYNFIYLQAKVSRVIAESKPCVIATNKEQNNSNSQTWKNHAL